ncbi:SDR family NAD(P)-dependent oxidoreductase [Paenibacillus sp. cl6col]|uniref:SDR family NAD(P)-dependent oxidoreductase n=1 Tax=Paenibacillus sp. cl6col TaxID=1761878 RepID=UPI000A82B25B|nr:SDR family NAD(P)-dependent oxidoreductase [Paenibacillus sp. cl6col]
MPPCTSCKSNHHYRTHSTLHLYIKQTGGTTLTSKQSTRTYRVATIRNPHQSSRLLHEAEAQGVRERIDIQVLDVNDPNSIATAAQYILSTYGSVRLLVNNAGFAIDENKQLGAAYSRNRPNTPDTYASNYKQ